MSDTATTQTAEQQIKAELHHTGREPLLPIEKKLIAWSLGTGIVLLVALLALTRLAA
ncbi:hypothetical protein [Xylophilus sp.]|uniref:hypothetical protein n=1 Tax=Xylophilus sp. TaxID=2653893 RepID=UPI0013B8356A|nr:hypothetical protein [Xylophilus sp.]KAF1042929.1 MAG: hypothetical protein GAK38_04146 [Xylophilus sp.]